MVFLSRESFRDLVFSIMSQNEPKTHQRWERKRKITKPRPVRTETEAQGEQVSSWRPCLTSQLNGAYPWHKSTKVQGAVQPQLGCLNFPLDDWKCSAHVNCSWQCNQLMEYQLFWCRYLICQSVFVKILVMIKCCFQQKIFNCWENSALVSFLQN